MSAPRFKAGDIVLDKVSSRPMRVIAGPDRDDFYAVQGVPFGRLSVHHADSLGLTEPANEPDEPDEPAGELLKAAAAPPLTVHVDFVELLRWADESKSPTTSMRDAVAELRDILEAVAS